MGVTAHVLVSCYVDCQDISVNGTGAGIHPTESALFIGHSLNYQNRTDIIIVEKLNGRDR